MRHHDQLKIILATQGWFNIQNQCDSHYIIRLKTKKHHMVTLTYTIRACDKFSHTFKIK